MNNTHASVTVSRVTDADYAVTTSTGNSDSCMTLVDGNVLRPRVRQGYIHTTAPLRLVLGPLALARILALQVGETVTLRTW